MINFGITPVALFHYIDPAQDPTFKQIDLAEITIIGTAYGELSLEALPEARPSPAECCVIAVSWPRKQQQRSTQREGGECESGECDRGERQGGAQSVGEPGWVDGSPSTAAASCGT